MLIIQILSSELQLITSSKFAQFVLFLVKPYEEKPCPICAPCVCFACPESWIVYEGKYFYVSKEAANWSTSSNICSSFNASLAVIATQEELVRNKWTKSKKY